MGTNVKCNAKGYRMINRSKHSISDYLYDSQTLNKNLLYGAIKTIFNCGSDKKNNAWDLILNDTSKIAAYHSDYIKNHISIATYSRNQSINKYEIIAGCNSHEPNYLQQMQETLTECERMVLEEFISLWAAKLEIEKLEVIKMRLWDDFSSLEEVGLSSVWANPGVSDESIIQMIKDTMSPLDYDDKGNLKPDSTKTFMIKYLQRCNKIFIDQIDDKLKIFGKQMQAFLKQKSPASLILQKSGLEARYSATDNLTSFQMLLQHKNQKTGDESIKPPIIAWNTICKNKESNIVATSDIMSISLASNNYTDYANILLSTNETDPQISIVAKSTNQGGGSIVINNGVVAAFGENICLGAWYNTGVRQEYQTGYIQMLGGQICDFGLCQRGGMEKVTSGILIENKLSNNNSTSKLAATLKKAFNRNNDNSLRSIKIIRDNEVAITINHKQEVFFDALTLQYHELHVKKRKIKKPIETYNANVASIYSLNVMRNLISTQIKEEKQTRLALFKTTKSSYVDEIVKF